MRKIKGEGRGLGSWPRVYALLVVVLLLLMLFFYLFTKYFA